MATDFFKYGPKKIKTEFDKLRLSDFQSLSRKDEIQYYIKTLYFPSVDLTSTINVVDRDRLNTLISTLKNSHLTQFKDIYKHKFDGEMGPGEILLYFLMNKAKLVGGSNMNYDMTHDGEKFEVKAIRVTADRHATEFRISKSISINDIVSDLYKLRSEISKDTNQEITINAIKDMRQMKPKEFAAIETNYKNAAYNQYFKDHKVIFINNNVSDKMGNIESIKIVSPSETMIERVTIAGANKFTIKPKIKL